MLKIGRVTLLVILSAFLSVVFVRAGLADDEEPAEATGEWRVPPDMSAVANPVATNDNSTATGKKIYEKECTPCHGPAGKGDGPKAKEMEIEKKMPDLNAKKTMDQSDGALFWKISIGRKPMHGYKKSLSDEERWDLVNYLRKLCRAQ